MKRVYTSQRNFGTTSEHKIALNYLKKNDDGLLVSSLGPKFFSRPTYNSALNRYDNKNLLAVAFLILTFKSICIV